MNSITISEYGNQTVVGKEAHSLYFHGDYPKTVQGRNRFFVLEQRFMPSGERWVMLAAQSTKGGAMKHMDGCGRVLVEFSETTP